VALVDESIAIRKALYLATKSNESLATFKAKNFETMLK
jgi:hypothetical protein